MAANLIDGVLFSNDLAGSIRGFAIVVKSVRRGAGMILSGERLDSLLH